MATRARKLASVTPITAPAPFVANPAALIHRPMADGKIATEMFRVPAAHLKCLMGAMAKGDTRFYLNGIYLDLDEQTPMLVATNGSVMARCPAIIDVDAHRPALRQFVSERQNETLDNGKCKWVAADQFIFRPEKLPPPGDDVVLAFDLRLGRFWDVTGYGAKRERHIEAMEDGVFVAWRRVDAHWPGNFKEAKSAREITFSLDLLSDIWKGPVMIEAPDQMGGYRVTLGSPTVRDVKVTLMPCRL
jgi:hypothetical protein